jgi:serine phosphatase RsbU (regulator of sigma subunit)
MPIGISDKRSKPFSKLKIEAMPNDMLYIYTDGFMDQFGGDKGKKFLSRNFKDLLVNTSHLPTAHQGEELGKRFDSWKGEYEQIDDILIIGVKI